MNDRLLRENREKIASLQRSAALLRKADLRIEGLEKMIAELNRQLAEKKTEVEQLRDELTRMGSEVETLAETVAERTAEVEDLSGEKLELENRLHTVYYIVGAEKELRDAQIVNKQGFIGRTLTVGQHGSMESFTQADSRLLSEIPVGHRKVTVVSTHPEGSYELVTDGSTLRAGAEHALSRRQQVGRKAPHHRSGPVLGILEGTGRKLQIVRCRPGIRPAGHARPAFVSAPAAACRDGGGDAVFRNAPPERVRTAVRIIAGTALPPKFRGGTGTRRGALPESGVVRSDFFCIFAETKQKAEIWNSKEPSTK